MSTDNLKHELKGIFIRMPTLDVVLHQSDIEFADFMSGLVSELKDLEIKASVKAFGHDFTEGTY